MKKNIYLIGFMGAGKSSVSRALAQQYGMPEVDTDRRIADMEGMTIPQIFETKGEAYFRELETEELRLLSKKTGWIVSCGGGMILSEENRRLMKKSGEIVYLSATPETIFERVRHTRNRPLLNGNMNVDYIAKLMQERQPYYDMAKTRELATDGRTPEELADEIMGIV